LNIWLQRLFLSCLQKTAFCKLNVCRARCLQNSLLSVIGDSQKCAGWSQAWKLKMLDLWFLTSYVSHTTTAHFLHYPLQCPRQFLYCSFHWKVPLNMATVVLVAVIASYQQSESRESVLKSATKNTP